MQRDLQDAAPKYPDGQNLHLKKQSTKEYVSRAVHRRNDPNKNTPQRSSSWAARKTRRRTLGSETRKQKEFVLTQFHLSNLEIDLHHNRPTGQFSQFSAVSAPSSVINKPATHALHSCAQNCAHLRPSSLPYRPEGQS